MNNFLNHRYINQSAIAKDMEMKPQKFWRKLFKKQRSKFSDAEYSEIMKLYFQFLKDIAIILAIIFFSSCRVTYSSKAYIAENIYKSANVIVLQLRNLSYTEGRDLLVDSAKCKQFDTILVKSRIKSFLCFGSEKVYILR